MSQTLIVSVYLIFANIRLFHVVSRVNGAAYIPVPLSCLAMTMSILHLSVTSKFYEAAAPESRKANRTAGAPLLLVPMASDQSINVLCRIHVISAVGWADGWRMSCIHCILSTYLPNLPEVSGKK